MATTVKQGTDLILFASVGGVFTPILQSTSHQIEETVETKEITSKDDGNEVMEIVVKQKWSLSSDGLASMNDNVDYFQLKKLLDAKKPIPVVFGEKVDNAGTLERVDGTQYLSGNALITKLSLNAPDKGETTYSVTLSGQGKLVTAVYLSKPV